MDRKFIKKKEKTKELVTDYADRGRFKPRKKRKLSHELHELTRRKNLLEIIVLF